MKIRDVLDESISTINIDAYDSEILNKNSRRYTATSLTVPGDFNKGNVPKYN